MDNSSSQSPLFDAVWTRDAAMAKMNPAQIHRRRLVRKYLQKLNLEPSNILDIGCGLGELLLDLKGLYPRAGITGCDLSSVSGEKLKSIFPEAAFCVIDAEKLQKFPGDKKFDLVTCSEVLEHCADPQAVVCNAASWLQSGGIFFVSVPSGPMTGYDKAIGHRRHYSESELKNLLSSQGFGTCRVWSWGFPFHTLYRQMVGAASKNIKNSKTGPSNFFWPYWVVSKMFNGLFYLNVSGKGRQLFAWATR